MATRALDWFCDPGSGSDLDEVLSLFNTLERSAGPADARALVGALERDDADFFDRNLAEGHDNDGFQVALWTLVEATPELSADNLRQL